MKIDGQTSSAICLMVRSALFLVVAIAVVTGGLNPAWAQVPFLGQSVADSQGGHGLAGADSPNGPAFSYYLDHLGGDLVLLESTPDGGQIQSLVDDNAGTLTPSDGTRSALIYINGNPHIIYRDAQGGSIRHAFRTGVTWSNVLISQGGSFPAATRCGDQICVCFASSAGGLGYSSLRYAQGSQNGAWSVSTVDAGYYGGLPGVHSVGSHCDIMRHSVTGKVLISYLDQTAGEVRVAEKAPGSNGGWYIDMLPAVGINWGMWSHLVELPDGKVKVIASKIKTEDTTSSDLGYASSIRAQNGFAWGPVEIVNGSYRGGYPTAVTTPIKYFEFVRLLRLNSPFPDTSYITYKEQNVGGELLDGFVGAVSTCVPEIRFMNSWVDAQGRANLAYYQRADSCLGAPPSSIMWYRNESAPPAVTPTPTPYPTVTGGTQDDYSLKMTASFSKAQGKLNLKIAPVGSDLASCELTAELSDTPSFEKIRKSKKLVIKTETIWSAKNKNGVKIKKSQKGKKASKVVAAKIGYVRTKLACPELLLPVYSSSFQFKPKTTTSTSAKALPGWLKALK